MAGCQWVLLPSCYGSKSTVHEHFQRWVGAVVFAEMFSLGAAKCEEFEGFKWDWQSMDGSLVQTPTRQSTDLSEEGIGRNPSDRGKSGSKIHLLVGQEGMPCCVVLAGANVHNSRLVTATVEGRALCAPKINPKEKPHLCLDKAYDMKWVETRRSLRY